MRNSMWTARRRERSRTTTLPATLGLAVPWPLFRRLRVEQLETRNLLSATVSGRVWNDANSDGLQTAGEANSQYAVAELINSVNGVIGDTDDVSLGTRITDANGAYVFTSVPASNPYYVVVRSPVGFTFTTQDVGSDNALDSDVSSIGRTAIFTPADLAAIDLDAGLLGSTASFGWAQGFGNSDVEWGIGVTTDAAGNTYLTGAFNDTVDFDPGPGARDLTSAGFNDIYVAKYTSAGALVWAIRAGSSTGHEQGNAIAVAPDGSSVLTGTMRGIVDFDPGPSVSNLTASGADVFVWKLSSDGALIWARRAGSTGSDDGFGIDLDASGSVAVAGSFVGTVDFDPSAGVSSLTAAGSTDIFVWKLNSAGNLVWANRAGRSGGDAVGRSLAYDSLGNLLITGWFSSGDVDFDPGASTVNLTASGIDAFVWKLSPAGGLVWARNVGASLSDRGFGIVVDADDNVITTGSFSGTTDFDPGGAVAILTANGIGADIFVWKLTSDGNYAWAKGAGSANNLDQGLALAVDGSGSVVVTGDFFGTVDFDPGTETTNLTSGGNTDAFVWKLSNAGNLVFVEKIGSTNGDSGRGVTVDASGNIRATGYFVGTADFAPGTSTQSLTGPGFQDAYLVRWDTAIAPNQPPTFTSGPDQTVDENSGLQTVPGWATGITTGGEIGQSLAFTSTVDPAWSSYAGGPQHAAVSLAPSQRLSTIRWQTPMDLNPQYSGELLLAHYGSPLISAANTVVIPVKTGATNGFKVEARDGADGTLKWTQTTDYILPPHGWVPSYAPTLTPRGRLYYAGAGGTVFFTDNIDSNSPGAPVRLAFYGLANYNSNAATYDSTVFINTPITSDAAGNIYFGFHVTGANPSGLTSGIARIAPNGTATYVSTTVASGDAGLIKVAMNAAPALSNDGSTLYVLVSSGNYGRGLLLALNSTTLALVSSTPLLDPRSGNNATIADNGTSSPTVGPDGDVYLGVLESPFGSNHYRGWLLHFSGNLAQSNPAGAFGWDITPSVVPASMVPSYTGTSSYLVMTKYNHYAGAGGDGVNKLAILDPNASMVDPVSGATVMKEVLTIAGVTPDVDILGQYPNAVREWCINTAVVDPSTGSVLVNSEDGKLYRWNLATNTFTESIALTAGLGQAYTPTLLGPDGTVYAINDAKLFAVGEASPPAYSGFFSVPPSVDPITGNLTYQVAPNMYGSARVTLTLADNGGTAGGGSDTSAPRSFLITSSPTELRVTKITPTATGFVAEFNLALNPGELNLYDQDGVLGVADLALTGNATGAVQGSVVVDSGLKKLTFIKTGELLSTDTYFMTLRSATNGFKDAQSGLLDGNLDGAPGDNYQAMIVSGPTAPQTVQVGVPDFARGFGQVVNVPATSSAGLPITVSNAVGVGSVAFTLRYDPALLTISGATLGPNVSGTLNFDIVSPGVVQISVVNAAGLSSVTGSQTLVSLTAQVPGDAPYGAKEILDITALQAFDTSVVPAQLPSRDDDGIHVAAYLGDANGSQTYNAPDATFTQRLIVGSNTGLSAYQLADPRLVVDINANGLVQANDVTSIQQAIVGIVGDVPPQPSLPAVTVDGLDPLVSIPKNLMANVGDTIDVPVEILVTEPSGIELAGVDLVIAYDPTALELTSVDIGTLLVGFGLNSNLSSPGLVRLSLTGSDLLSLPLDATGVLATLRFTVSDSASGLTAINLLAEEGSLRTALYDFKGRPLTLQPAPSNAADDLVDGSVDIVAPDTWAESVDAALAEL